MAEEYDLTYKEWKGRPYPLNTHSREPPEAASAV